MLVCNVCRTRWSGGDGMSMQLMLNKTVLLLLLNSKMQFSFLIQLFSFFSDAGGAVLLFSDCGFEKGIHLVFT